MPIHDVNELLTQQMVRLFFQFGGAKRGFAMAFYGQQGQYAFYSGESESFGDITRVRVPDPTTPNKYRTVAKSRGAPDDSSATLDVYQKIGIVPRNLGSGCAFNLYLPVGNCPDLSDLNNANLSYVHIVSDVVATGRAIDHMSMDGTDPLQDSYDLNVANVYNVGRMRLGEFAATEVVREVADLAYSPVAQCADCGPENDGTRWLYALQQDDLTSGAIQAVVLYNTNGGQGTWTSVAITGVSANEQVYGVEVTNGYVIVVGTDAYYYAPINTVTGAPGTWTKVTTGFVATKSPRDLFVLSSRQAYFAGLAGHIYQWSDVTSGVTVLNNAATSQDLSRISGDGSGQTLVAVGAAGAVVVSLNAGRTWATVTAPANAVLNAVAVVSKDIYWVGTADGRVWSTVNGGVSWTELAFTGSGAGSVSDIVFATKEVGYFTHSTGTVATVWTTYDGGQTWFGNNSFRLGTQPVFQRGNRIAVPSGADIQTLANTVAIGGLGSGTDGVIYQGVAAQL